MPMPVLQEIYDNTKLSHKRKCLRFYYYRHERQWTGEGLAPPLVFGLSWHSAMDIVWQYPDGSKQDVVNLAMQSFLQTWEGEGAPNMEHADFDVVEKWNPRLPSVAAEMLHAYIDKRGPIMRGAQLIAVEAPFVVPLWPEEPNIWYAGRKDKKIIHQGDRVVVEHKSTTDYKKDGGFKAAYVESWNMSPQCMGYLYSDNVLSEGKTEAVWVDAALVHKQVHDAFRIIPVKHKYGQLDQWLFDTRNDVAEIRRNHQLLMDLRESGEVKKLKFLPVFGRNQESCIDRFGQKCPYFNVCTQFPNPEQFDGPPPAMIEKEWNPFDVLNLQQLIDKETLDASEV